MLHINADDFGRSAKETDLALACLAARRITSATAMVFMEDSQRAAESTLGSRWDVGLHLNLSERFSAPSTPAKLRERHERICRFLKSSRYALVMFNPLLVRDFDYVVRVQLDEFARSYGRLPSRVDGHQHMHLATNVLWQGLLPAGIRVRRSFSFDAGAKGALNLWYRRRVDARLAKRHKLTDRFHGLSSHLEWSRLSALCLQAKTLDIELMTHPVRADEYRMLMSDSMSTLLAETPVCSGEQA
jgi:chitin disaccharide deacetylase